MATPHSDDRPHVSAWTFEGTYRFAVNAATRRPASGPDRLRALHDAAQQAFADQDGFSEVAATIDAHDAIVVAHIDEHAAPTVRAAIDLFEATMHSAARSIGYPDDGEIVGVAIRAAGERV